jgi:GNAT superfamily N-acetyltransferase
MNDLFRHLTLRTGTMRDYQALAPYHYCGKSPWNGGLVYALDFDSPRFQQCAGHLSLEPRSPVAVVVYMNPVPNCFARDAATKGRYAHWPDPRSGLLLLNREMRTVSRLVVEPRFRGLGLGVSLLKATLPLLKVPLVEALARMGELVPVFERAGFQRVKTRTGTPYFLWRSNEL